MARSKRQLALRLERNKIANWLLEWFDAKQMYRGSKAHENIIVPFSQEKRIEVYEVWQAWNILKTAGRRSASPGPCWAILSWEPVEADGDGNINVDKDSV